jgi:hypothetical protein
MAETAAKAEEDVKAEVQAVAEPPVVEVEGDE